MSTDLSITLHADSDGFISYECPFCNSTFKLSASDINDENFPIEELFCPYCGLADSPNKFLSTAAEEAINNLVHNYAANMLNQEFSKMARSINSKKGLLSMKYKPIEMLPEKDVSDDDSPGDIVKCNTCERAVKVFPNAGMSKVFCPYCGVTI